MGLWSVSLRASRVGSPTILKSLNANENFLLLCIVCCTRFPTGADPTNQIVLLLNLAYIICVSLRLLFLLWKYSRASIKIAFFLKILVCFVTEIYIPNRCCLRLSHPGRWHDLLPMAPITSCSFLTIIHLTRWGWQNHISIMATCVWVGWLALGRTLTRMTSHEISSFTLHIFDRVELLRRRCAFTARTWLSLSLLLLLVVIICSWTVVWTEHGLLIWFRKMGLIRLLMCSTWFRLLICHTFEPVNIRV